MQLSVTSSVVFELKVLCLVERCSLSVLSALP